jgi:hypothetical protein
MKFITERMISQPYQVKFFVLGISSLIPIIFSYFSLSQAQLVTNNQTVYTLGFYLVDSEKAVACTINNGTAKIEANILETNGSKIRKAKIEIKFKNGQVSVKDKEDILRTKDSTSYGLYYYLDAKILGQLKVDFKSGDKNKGKGNKESTIVDMNFDNLPPVDPDPSPNQIEEPTGIASYYAFTLPCN